MNIKLVHESFKYTVGIGCKSSKMKEVEEVQGGIYYKNDWAAFQVFITTGERMVVALNDDPAFDKSSDAKVYRIKARADGINESDIEVKFVDPMKDDDSMIKADRLSEHKYAVYEKNQWVNLWVKVDLPVDTEPGTYTVDIFVYEAEVFGEESLVGERSYTIEVKDLQLPEPKDYKFFLDLWQHNSNIARKYDTTLWSEEHFQIIEKYVASLGDLGQKAVSLMVSEIPWSGQNSLGNPIDPADFYEYNMVRLCKNKEGFQYDFTAMDRYIDVCNRYGINQEYEVFGLINVWTREEQGYGRVIEDYDDGVRVRYYDQETERYAYMTKKADYLDYVKALETYFTNKDIVDKVRIIADEPADFERYTMRLDTLRKAAPTLRYKAAINHVEFIEKDIDNLEDYCPGLGHMLKAKDDFNRIIKECEGRFTYYVCCGPQRPNTFLDSHLLESRMIPWLAEYFKLEGFLRWNYTVWTDEPNEDIRCAYPSWPAGDTNFVYPGKQGNPVYTLRYHNLRRGIRDFEIMSMLKEKCPDVGLHSQLEDFFIPMSHISMDYFLEESYSKDYTLYEKFINNCANQLIED